MITFAALADPTRFRIVELLAANGRMAAGQIGKKFSVSAPAISQHLKVLKETKLVQVEVQGQQRIYSLNTAGIGEIGDWAAKLTRQWEERFDALEEVLKEEVRKLKSAKRGKK